MSDEITMLVFSEDDTTMTAYGNAISRVRDHLPGENDIYQISPVSHPDNPDEKYVVPLDSQEGEALLEESLERTRNAQKRVLANLVEHLNNTTNMEDLLTDDEFRHCCWQLGADRSPTFSFFDGTNQNPGSAIHSRDTVDSMRRAARLPLYLAVVNCS